MELSKNVKNRSAIELAHKKLLSNVNNFGVQYIIKQFTDDYKLFTSVELPKCLILCKTIYGFTLGDDKFIYIELLNHKLLFNKESDVYIEFDIADKRLQRNKIKPIIFGKEIWFKILQYINPQKWIQFSRYTLLCITVPYVFVMIYKKILGFASNFMIG